MSIDRFLLRRPLPPAPPWGEPDDGDRLRLEALPLDAERLAELLPLRALPLPGDGADGFRLRGGESSSEVERLRPLAESRRLAAERGRLLLAGSLLELSERDGLRAALFTIDDPTSLNKCGIKNLKSKYYSKYFYFMTLINFEKQLQN